MPHYALGMDEHWKVDYFEGTFERSFSSLGPYEQAVLGAAVKHVLAPGGMDVCRNEWGKNLGKGLYEFRIRRSLRTILREHGPAGAVDSIDLPDADRKVLLRAFCTFHGSRVVLLLSVYNKGKDPSEKRQAREIKAARQALRRWREEG